ncbi:relaxase/mobilization nuclease domain-containing protein [Corynebacterium gottingense]|uniref:relaxase/mobilization nuclease domain-containing protein n=1 Tax=Corynebacterium gottingense TaxID=2041036 RepID=UPI0038D207B7
MRNDDVRAAAYSVVSATPNATPEQFISDTVAEIARHPQRVNEAEIEIQSFHPDELSSDDPFDVQLAHLAGLELARRLAPNTDVVVATHTDSKSGHLHNHIIYANHDRVTGTTPRNVRNFHKVKHINDEVMKDLGLEVYEPEPAPEPLQDYSHLKNSPLPVITKENWRSEMQQRVDAVLADTRVAAAPSVDEGLEVAQSIAADYSLSFRVTTHEKENRDDVTVTSYALVDDSGEVIRYSTSRGSRSTKRTGSRLGKDSYTLEAVEERIKQLQQQYQQVIRQQQIRTQQENYDGPQTQEEEHSEPEPTTVTAGGTFGIGGTESLTDKYADILTDAGTTADTGAAPGAAEEEHTDAVHGERTGRTVYDVGEGRSDGRPRPDGRDVPGRERDRQHQAATGSSGSALQPESAPQHGAAEPQTTRRRTPAPWSADGSVEDMRQVDFDFLAERVMDDEFRQFQRSEFAGTDAEYFAHLLDDDGTVAEDHENYAHSRTRLFNPVGDRREYFLRSVGENRRLAAAARRQRQERQQQQHRQNSADFGSSL